MAFPVHSDSPERVPSGRCDHRRNGCIPGVCGQFVGEFVLVEQRDNRDTGAYPAQRPVVRPAATAEPYAVLVNGKRGNKNDIRERKRVHAEPITGGPRRPVQIEVFAQERDDDVRAAGRERLEQFDGTRLRAQRPIGGSAS